MKWQAKTVIHKGAQRIKVYFEGTPDIHARIKQLADVRWSKTFKACRVPDSTV